MRFGVNYVPSKRWMHAWVDFDEGQIREDLQAIKELGMDHIRAHLIWSYFQVNPTSMSQHCLKNLERFVKICEDTGIDFVLSLFTGWMSGFYFFPSWVHPYLEHEFSMFTGDLELQAERFYVNQIAKVVADSPAFLGFDLGNELSMVTILDKNADKSICDRWQTEMLKLCEELAPGKLHNNGVDHQPWLMEAGFSKEVLATTGAVTPLHCWTEFSGARQKSGLMGTLSVHLCEYMSELVKAYHTEPNRKVWIQEFGCSKEWVQEAGDNMELFTVKTLDNIAGCSDIWGLTWWCSHDINACMSNFVPNEYDFGLLDSANNVKDNGKVVSDWIKNYKKSAIIPYERKTALLFDEEMHARDMWYNGDRFMELIEKGEHPSIILEKNADNAAYLKARGIEKIIR